MRRLSAGDNDRGAVAVVVALLMVVLLGMGALVVDVGAMYAERRQLQNGADAAALAVARDCARGSCDVGTGPSSTAGSYANGNANDFVSGNGATGTTVTEVCGSAPNLPGLTGCRSPGGAGPWDCPALPTTLSSANYVQVRTETLSNGEPRLVPLLAQVLGSTGSPVRACARVSWGGMGGVTSAMPLTISYCEFEDIVGDPPSAFAPAPPYPPYPNASWERTIFFHDATTGNPKPCPAGRSGSDEPLNGSFGWLDSTNCNATSTVTGWYTGKTGSAPGNDCKPGQLDDLIGNLVYIPVYEGTRTVTGTRQYAVRGYAAFVLTGYNLGGGYKEESIISGTPRVYPCANDPRTGSQRCISGFFTEDLVPTTGTIGGPALGAPPVVQMTG